MITNLATGNTGTVIINIIDCVFDKASGKHKQTVPLNASKY